MQNKISIGSFINFLYKNNELKLFSTENGFKKEKYEGYLFFLAKNVENRYLPATKIPKKSGGTREIVEPKKILKEAQSLLKSYISEIIRCKPCLIPKSTYGLTKGKDIFANAVQHEVHGVHVGLDIANFFGSVKYRDVKKIFSETLNFDERSSNLFSRISTKGYVLPQGVPTSSILASLFLIDMDKKIEKFSEEDGVLYTRYADDLVFSGSSEDKIKPTIDKAKKIISNKGLKINREKEGLTEYITGLKPCDGIMITKYHCGEEKHENLKMILLKDDDKRLGVLNFIKSADPAYYSELVKHKKCIRCSASK